MSHLLISRRVLLSIGMALACAVAAPVGAQDAAGKPAAGAPALVPKIGFVSLDRILRDSTPSKAAQAALEQEFSDRRKELAETGSRLRAMFENLEKNAAVLSDIERARKQKEFTDQDKDYQRRQRELAEDVNQRQNEEFAKVVNKANRVIRQLAEAQGFDLIVQEAVYVSPRVDLTDQVIALLNADK